MFWGIAMYDNKVREIKFKPRIKLNHNIYNYIHAKVSSLFWPLGVSRVHYCFCLNIPLQRRWPCEIKKGGLVWHLKLPWKGAYCIFYQEQHYTFSQRLLWTQFACLFSSPSWNNNSIFWDVTLVVMMLIAIDIRM